MDSEAPKDPAAFDDVMKLAVDGEVVLSIEMKADEIVSDLEDEVTGLVLKEAMEEMFGEYEVDEDVIARFDPELRFYEQTDDGEMAWSDGSTASELGLLD